uniref:Uncharacterized protein n=1 Tax=Rhizophora mucronata TaxID=61149 RepID=A0A2P2R1D3_RHIMU
MDYTVNFSTSPQTKAQLSCAGSMNKQDSLGL